METNKPTPSQIFEEGSNNLKEFLKESNVGSAVGQVFGRYKIEEELGQGGMGRVYKAYDTQLQRIVALKFLISTKKPDIERFLREARATAKLNHPHIVTLYDIGEQSGQPFFTMDYIEGCSLKFFLQKNPMTVRHIAKIMNKVASAIVCAHKEGIIHRDLKPENIMMDTLNEPKVMDFGLAKVAKANRKLSKTGMIIGTLQYMPPEQAQGKLSSIDERSDVYALGAILYELLTAVPPFSGSTSFNILYQIINKNPVAPTKIKKRIPKDLENICLKALEKKKEHRYQSAREFMEDLSRFDCGEEVHACSVGATKRFLRKVKGNKLFVAAILLLAIFAILAIIKVQKDTVKVQMLNFLGNSKLKVGPDVYEMELKGKVIGKGIRYIKLANQKVNWNKNSRIFSGKVVLAYGKNDIELLVVCHQKTVVKNLQISTRPKVFELYNSL